MDIKNAFLNEILKDIYIVQPKKYENNNCKGLVCKLKWVVYALK
jgi:hypothetical protein